MIKMLKILCALFWVGAGFFGGFFLQRPHLPLFLFLSVPLMVSCFLLWFSNSKHGLFVRLTLFLLGGTLCFLMPDATFPLSTRLAASASMLLVLFALPFFSYLCQEKTLSSLGARISFWSLWVLLAFFQASELVPISLLLAFFGGAALAFKASGFHVSSAAYWKARTQEKIELKRLEARQIFLENLMHSRSFLDPTN